METNKYMLSIIIVNYNTCNLLLDCLNSIYNTTNINFEIIVVDNNSSDDSVFKIRSEFPEVKIIENRKNLGYAKAINHGFKESKGEIILFLNSDTIMIGDAIKETLNFLISRKEIGLLGCKLLNKDKTLQLSCRSFPSIWNYFTESFFLYKLFPKIKIFGKFYMSHFKYDKVQEVDVVMGAFMMIKREIFNKIYGFDEKFFMYSEETDFCYRAKNAGWKVVFYPNAEIIHIGGGSTKLIPEKMFIESHKSQIKFCYKHHRKLYADIEKFLIFLGVLVRYTLAKLGCFFLYPRNFKKRRDIYSSALNLYITKRK